MPPEATARDTSGRLAGWAVAIFLAAWSAALVVPPLALLGWRESRLARLDDPTVQADWDVFREDMRRQSGREGPVQRKVPRSSEPPERVWLRDYVGLAIVAWGTLVGVLGAFLGAIIRGIIRGTPDRAWEPRQGRTCTADTFRSTCVQAPSSTAEHHAGREGDRKEEHDRDAEDAEE